MDLQDEFAKHALSMASESGDRLRGADVRARLDARVTRGRRVHHAKVGVGAFAVAGTLTVGAVLMPRLAGGAIDPAGTGAATASDVPAPSFDGEGPAPSSAPAVTLEPVDSAAMPKLGADGYLAGTVTVWDVSGPLTCEALAESGPLDGAGFDVLGQRAPLPAWLETGRLYGWADDLLVGGTAAPLAAVGQADYEAVQALASDFSAGPGELVLTGADGVYWGFTVTWEERDDLPHDAPGVFAVLTPNYECNDGVPPQGVYEARMAYRAGDQSTQVVQLEPITVVSGVPSLPEVDAAGR